MSAILLCGGQSFVDVARHAIPLMTGVSTSALLADKVYDAYRLLDWLQEHSITAVIPPNANRKVQRSCDWYQYKKCQPFQGDVGLCCSPVVAALIHQQSLVFQICINLINTRFIC
jgi:transposase